MHGGDYVHSFRARDPQCLAALSVSAESRWLMRVAELHATLDARS